MKEDQSCSRGEIETLKRRLAEREARGIAAISQFDVEIADGGNGQMALDVGKQLVRSHIKYDTATLEEVGPEVRQLAMFGELVPGADVFKASALRGESLETGIDTDRGEDFQDWDSDDEELL